MILTCNDDTWKHQGCQNESDLSFVYHYAKVGLYSDSVRDSVTFRGINRRR